MPLNESPSPAVPRRLARGRIAASCGLVILALLLARDWPMRGFGQDAPAEGAQSEATAADASSSAETDDGTPAAEAAEKPAATTPPVELPPELKPYSVLISLSFSGDASFDADFRERMAAGVPILIRSRLGQMWNMTVRDDGFLSPAAPAVLERMSGAELNAAFLPSAFDKVILIAVGREGSAYRVAGREWDRNSRTSGPGIVRETYDRRQTVELVADVATEVFRPVAMIRQVGEDDVIELGIRAGEFLAADEDAEQFHPGDYLTTYLRYLDRERNVGQIQYVPWTFLQVDMVERARVLCHLVSTFRRSPLGGSRRRVELMAIAAKPLLPETELTLVPRVDPLNPLVGHRVDVMDRLPTAEDAVEDRVTLLTDRRGVVLVPANPEAPLRRLLVHSGGAVLASVPMIPGLEQQMILELPDDTPRLDVEGQIQIMQAELIDVFATRIMLMTRARGAAKANRWEDVDRFRQELDQLKTYDDFDRELETVQVTGVQIAKGLGDRVAQSRIARMCREFREVAELRLSDDPIKDFHTEMDELRSAAKN